MGGGTWFQIDLNKDSKLESNLLAFMVHCCLFSKVKENIQENIRKPVYSLEIILLDLIPSLHCTIIYIKTELTPAKPRNA